MRHLRHCNIFINRVKTTFVMTLKWNTGTMSKIDAGAGA